jgi:tripartite-type tricarboxylate transporter receptor subunit TctC
MDPRPASLPTRRSLLAAALASATAAAFGQAAPWPTKPIRFITPAPAGVAPDVFARLYAEQLAKALGVAVVVENRPGAALIIGTEAVAKAAPDGYTLLYGTNSPFTMNPALYARLPYDPQKDFAPVVQNITGAYFLVAGNDFPAKDLAGLVALAREKPDAIAYGSYGSGTAGHLGFELLQEATRIQLRHVPYKQGVLNDVIGGQVAMSIEPAASIVQFIKTGRVKALAYTGSKRSAVLPDVPTLSETVPGLELLGWHGVWAPAGTPPAIVARLNAEINHITRSPDMARRIADMGFSPAASTPQELASIVARESDSWGKLIRAKGIRLD